MILHHPPLDPALCKWVLLPALIFFARIGEVTIGTLRIIFVSKSMRYLAPVMGFLEALIWLLAIGQIMQNLNDVACYAAYAIGFSAGNYIGIWFENRLAVGLALIRIMIQHDAEGMVAYLKKAGCSIATFHAEGMSQPTKMLLTIVKRKEIDKVLESLKRRQPSAIYTIEDVRSASPQALLFQT
jgi:uncharacterized protein YebE (UPF0316 family)